MKIVFLSLLIALNISCVKTTSSVVKDVAKTTPDTVYVEVPTLNEERIKELESDVAYWKNVADSANNTIPFNDYINARRIEKIKYYISICEKNSNNKKFFYGWIKRTIDEK